MVMVVARVLVSCDSHRNVDNAKKLLHSVTREMELVTLLRLNTDLQFIPGYCLCFTVSMTGLWN